MVSDSNNPKPPQSAEGPSDPSPYPVLYIDLESEPFPLHGTEWPGGDDADE